MITIIEKPINRNLEAGSSVLVLDIRDSSTLVRRKSFWNYETKSKQELIEHTQFMVSLYQKAIQLIDSNFPNESAFNDTGDGLICVFWDEKHTLTCLDAAIQLFRFASSSKYIKANNIHFGIGIHTGGSVIYRTNSKIFSFAFGIACNTAARVESFTKNLIELDKFPAVLITGNFYQHYLHQSGNNNPEGFKKISQFRFNLNDGKERGHLLYTLDQGMLNE